MAGTCRKGFSKNLETYPCIIARPGADFNGQMRFCGLKLREHPYPFGSLTPSPPIFWPNIRSLCAPPVRSEANAGACRVAAYGNQIVSPRCCRTSPHIPHAETVQLLLGFNAPQYSPAFSFIPTLYMIPPHMPSRGAAPFYIGSCAHCNMVLHFSRLSSVAVLRRICLARKRCSFSWTLARRLPSRVSLFLPSVAYDFTAYALVRGYAVPHQAMYISQHGSAAQRVCQLR